MNCYGISDYFKKILNLDHGTFIIAEIGVNHNGSVQLAKELVSAAKAAGADAVKFQTYKAEELVIPDSPMVEYQKKNYTDKFTYFEMLKKYELSYENFRDIASFCKEQEIIFFSKGYINQIDFLESLNVPIHKIDSASIIYYSLIHEVAKLKKLVLLSTGMANMNEIFMAVEIMDYYECPTVILHCTSSYPTPAKQVNFKTISFYQKVFKKTVGFSDHSEGLWMPIAATALGAEVIEKHFTIDCSMDGPDHKASIEPEEFRKMVLGIREVVSALGNEGKFVTKEEEENKAIMRRSWHFKRSRKAGETVSTEDLIFCRPDDGLPEPEIKNFLGHIVVKDIKDGAPVNWDCFIKK